jgi:hypothetical protein
MSQSPPPRSLTSPSSPKILDIDFTNNLNPEPLTGVMNLNPKTRQQMLDSGKLYKASDLRPGFNVINGEGGRSRSKKRPTARRRRSSKARKARKARTTRRR